MKLISYEYSHKQLLGKMLTDYFNEMEGGCVGSVNAAITTMLNNNRHIYLLFKGNKAIGFIVMYVNNQYGLTTPTAVNEYMYLEPEHRTSVASKYLLLQAFDYCSNMDMDLYGTTYLTSHNIHNMEVLGAKPIAEVFKIDLSTMNNKLKQLRKDK